jgi:serine/threonine protein kinase
MIDSIRRKVKVIDFDFAQNVIPGKTSTFYAGTPGYFSPEICKLRPYSLEKNQVWQLGVVLYELYFLASPFSNRDKNVKTLTLDIEAQMVVDAAVYGWRKHSRPLMKFLVRMLSKDEKLRPSLAEVSAFNFLAY